MDNKIQKIRKCVKDTRKENATIANTRGVKKKEEKKGKKDHHFGWTQSVSSKGGDYSQSLDLSLCCRIPLAGQS